MEVLFSSKMNKDLSCFSSHSTVYCYAADIACVVRDGGDVVSLQVNMAGGITERGEPYSPFVSTSCCSSSSFVKMFNIPRDAEKFEPFSLITFCCFNLYTVAFSSSVTYNKSLLCSKHFANL